MSPHITKTRGEFLASTDPELLDIPAVHAYISQRSYWGRNVPFSTVQLALQNSLVVGLYDTSGHIYKQIGCGRWITDYATFGYLSDVYVEEEYQGKGLGKWLVECLMSLPQLAGLRRKLLITAGAEELYRTYAGFKVAEQGARGTYMEIVRTAEELYGSGVEGKKEKTYIEELEEGQVLMN